MRRHFGSALALMAAIVLAGGSGGANKAATAEIEIPTVEPGDTFELDGVAYTTRTISAHPTVGRGRHTRLASMGAKFVVVDYEATNKTDKPIGFLTLGPSARDGQGREFSTSAEAQWAIVRTNGRQTMAQTLQPGVTERRATVFEVPDDALPTLELVWKTGLLGKEKRVMPAGLSAP